MAISHQISDWLNEQMFILFSMYYYEVFILQGKVQVGRFVQSINYSPTFLISFAKKLGWALNRKKAIIKGHKLIMYVQLDYALPMELLTDIQITELKDNVIKTEKVTKLVTDVTQKQITESENLNIVKVVVIDPKYGEITESNMPTHMVFEMFNAYFVTKVLSKPKSTDWGFVIMGIMVCVVIIVLVAIFVFGVIPQTNPVTIGKL